MANYEIPLSAANQSFTVTLGTTDYRLTVIYRDAKEAGWILDIADTEGNAIVSGIPLVTGHDLLEQYAYLGIGGQMIVATTGDPYAVPTFENLGDACKLYWIPDA